MENDIHDQFTRNFDKIPFVTRELIEDYFFENDNIMQIVVNNRAEEEDLEIICEHITKNMNIPENIEIRLSYQWMLDN